MVPWVAEEFGLGVGVCDALGRGGPWSEPGLFRVVEGPELAWGCVEEGEGG